MDASVIPSSSLNLMDQVMEMMELALAIYGLADLRKLARQEILPEAVAMDVLALPMTAKEIGAMYSDHYETIQKLHWDGANFMELYSTAAPHLHRLAEQQRSAPTTQTATTPDAASAFETVKIVVFDDEHSEKELVYALGINSARKRITLCFRGSVTVADFITDARQTFVRLSNPVSSNTMTSYTATETVGIHKGFNDYLNEVPQRGGVSKYDQILPQLYQLLEEHPDYSIHLTGHSLGGALATLFAFRLAATEDPRIPKPITCVSIASPRVGNLEFRRAFQELERQRLLYCLRVSNDNDLITIMPERGTFSCACVCCLQNYLYRHVGIQLRLRPTSFEIKHPRAHQGYLRQVKIDTVKKIRHLIGYFLTLPCRLCYLGQDPILNHSCKEYFNRLEASSKDLRLHTLQGLYDKKHKREHN